MAIYLQKYDSGKLGKEEQLIFQYALMERIPVVYFSSEELFKQELALNDCDLLVGSVECYSEALRQMGKKVPCENYYPQSIRGFLHRDVWIGNKYSVLMEIASGKEVFAKPFEIKRFTGQVFSESEGYSVVKDLDQDEKLYLSEVVTWINEYRVYVNQGEIVAIAQYMGEDETKLDVSCLDLAIDKLQEAGEAPESFAFDWGILSTGETALIEFNDAWAIGAYKGIGYREYYEFLRSRWKQLTQ